MSTIAALYRRVQNFDVAATALKSLEQTKEEMADFNVDQLKRGENNEGGNMPNYSKTSVNVFGKPEGPIRLYDIGDFYRGLYVKVENGEIVTSSTDDKTDMLFNRFAKEDIYFFGLNPKSKSEFIKEYLQKTFMQNVKEETGL